MTAVASHTPSPAPPNLPAVRNPMRLAGIAKPLIALSRDEQLIAALRKVTDPVHEVLASGAEVELSGALLAHHAGVAVLDCAALVTPVATLTEQLHAQFPELVLVVSGSIDEQAQLAARIADGAVHRFLHKPFSEQRVRLFVEAAWRQHALIRATTAEKPARRLISARAWRRWGGLAAFALLAAALTPFLWQRARVLQPQPRPLPSAALPSASVPQTDAQLEQLLGRAARALASGALVAPPADNALELYRAALARHPADARAQAGLAQLASRLLDAAQAELAAQHLQQAQHLLDQARALGADETRTAAMAAALAAASARAAATKAEPGAAPRAARVADYLSRARDAEARNALIEPAQDNARLYIESARAVAPEDAAVLAAQSELGALLEEAARRALTAADPDSAERLAAAALENGVDPARVNALREDAQQLRDAQHTQATAHLAEAFDARLKDGRIDAPATDCAQFYLQQLLQQDPAGAQTQQARSAYRARVLEEARSALAAHDFSAAQHWLDEARSTGAEDAQLAQLAADLTAAQAAARQGASYVAEGALQRTRYVAPQFPELARARGIDGWVDLQFLVGTDGSVSEVTVVGAQPAGVFEQAAVEALRQWRYQPVTHGGQPLAQHARVRVRFVVKQ